MPTLELSHDECNQLMNRLINSDPLLMKIAAQLRGQTPAEQPAMTTERAWASGGNSKEARRE